MSKHQIVRSLRSEIKKLNYLIDQKIIAGMPYYRESRRHKFLVSQMNHLTPQGTNWFARSMTFASLFMF